MMYNNFNELFDDVDFLKQQVTNLDIDSRIAFKQQFFNLNFKEWQLSLIWEYFWDDKLYKQIYTIFLNKKLIKKEGDQLGKRQY